MGWGEAGSLGLSSATPSVRWCSEGKLMRVWRPVRRLAASLWRMKARQNELKVLGRPETEAPFSPSPGRPPRQPLRAARAQESGFAAWGKCRPRASAGGILGNREPGCCMGLTPTHQKGGGQKGCGGRSGRESQVLSTCEGPRPPTRRPNSAPRKVSSLRRQQ